MWWGLIIPLASLLVCPQRCPWSTQSNNSHSSSSRLRFENTLKMCLADSACERPAEAEWGKGAEQKQQQPMCSSLCAAVSTSKGHDMYLARIHTLSKLQIESHKDVRQYLNCWYPACSFYLSNSATYCFGHWPSKAFLGVRVSAGFQDAIASLAPASLSTGRSVCQ